MNRYIAVYRSEDDIRKKAQQIREIVHVTTGKIDLLYLLDYITVYDKPVNVEILEDSDSYFSKDEEAKTDIKKKTIYLKRSVIEEAATNEHCRANFTISHEIAHVLLHDESSIKFVNDETNYKYNKYEDPEWQADTFAAELLMPYTQCKHMSVEQIYENFNVTITAAGVRYSILHPYYWY